MWHEVEINPPENTQVLISWKLSDRNAVFELAFINDGVWFTENGCEIYLSPTHWMELTHPGENYE